MKKALIVISSVFLLISFAFILSTSGKIPGINIKASGPTGISTGPVTNPGISFNADHSVVSISYLGRSYIMPRPVVDEESWMKQEINPYGGRMLWVSTTGNDSNSGTKSSPFFSIQKGIDTAAAGDIVYIQPGTYLEHLDIYKSGSAGKPIVVTSAPNSLGQVKLIFPPSRYAELVPLADGTWRHAVIDVGQATTYVTINGLVLEGYRGQPNTPANDDYGASGIGIGGPVTNQNIIVSNNVVYNNLHCGIKGGTGILVKGNVIFANGTDSLDHPIYAAGDNTQVIGNILFDGPGYGIHGYNMPQNLYIIKNIAFNIELSGIIVGGPNAKVYNNVSVYNGQGMFYFRPGNTGTITRDNIFAYNNINLDVDNGVAGNSDDYDLFFGGGAQYGANGIATSAYTLGYIGSHEVFGDPLFVNASIGDFRIQPGSPAINKGIDVGLAFSGSAPDIGAFETGSISPTPTATPAPPTPTATPFHVPGDTNNDGKVDGIDYVTVIIHFGQNTTSGYSAGDLNLDGKVDQSDLTLVISNIH